MTSELDRVLRPEYLGDLPARPIDEIREMRAECQAVETGLSYLRRMIQGRLDIVTNEVQRRADGDPVGRSDDLVAELTEILTDRTRSEGAGRLPQSIGTGHIDPDLEAALDDVIAASHLSAVADLGDDTLADAVNRLADLETEVSKYRRDLFEQLDALQAEIARRYRSGEASVESLLG